MMFSDSSLQVKHLNNPTSGKESTDHEGGTYSGTDQLNRMDEARGQGRRLAFTEVTNRESVSVETD